MSVGRARRTSTKDAIVCSLLSAGGTLLPIRLRTAVEARLAKRTADSTWSEALARLVDERFITDPSAAATAETNQALIAELTADFLTAGPGEISLTNLGRIYALALGLESMAAPAFAADAKGAVEQLLSLAVSR